MQVVEILSLTAAGDGTLDDIIAGRLTWDGSGDIQAWSTDDKYNVLMQNILNEPIHDVDTDELIDSIDNPQEFMDRLRYKYSSAYLRATEPREVDDSEITAFKNQSAGTFNRSNRRLSNRVNASLTLRPRQYVKRLRSIFASMSLAKVAI